MVFTRIEIQDLNLDKRKKTLKKAIGDYEYKHVEEFLRLCSLGRINKRKKLTEKTLNKYIEALRVFILFFSKKIDDLVIRDIENFDDALEKNKIMKRDNKPYSELTKKDFIIASNVYLKWRLPQKAVELTEWRSTARPKRTIEYLKESEIQKLYDNCKSAYERFTIAVLFDSGARASEFFNIRFEDIIPPTQTNPYYKIDLKEEYSKTKGRIISMFWKNSTKAISDYLDEVSGKPSDPIIKKDYDAVRMFIVRLGKKVLKKRVHFHLFRKASATYYATLLNRQELCYRYGWVFSSDVVDVYISRQGLAEEQVKEKISNIDMQKLERKNQELETQLNIMREQIAKNQEELYNKLKEDFKKQLRKNG